jgi:glutathione S-transferase
MLNAIEQPQLAQDERFTTRNGRVTHYDTLRALLGTAFKARPRADWLPLLEANDVPHAPIHRVSEVDQDPQVRHLGLFYQTEHPERGTMRAIHRPVLIDGDITIWESLAIIEYLAEKFPDAGLWPKEVAARAHARVVSNEMHAGFLAMRGHMPVNFARRIIKRDLPPAVAADIKRIEAFWSDCRARFGQSGQFLFGAFCAADAMFAPVVTRFITYDVKLDSDCTAYCKAIMALPAMQDWQDAALGEPDEVVELDVEF